MKRNIFNNNRESGAHSNFNIKDIVFCNNCQDTQCSKVAIPYVLRYLTNELAAMNINLTFQLEE